MKEPTEAQKIALDILNLCAGKDHLHAVAAMNYAMGQLLHDHFGGTEDALAHSDQQVRAVVEMIRGVESH